MERVDAALHDMILANEPALRTMLAHALQRGLKGDDPTTRGARTAGRP